MKAIYDTPQQFTYRDVEIPKIKPDEISTGLSQYISALVEVMVSIAILN
jgi:hypothetical protein